MYTHLHEVAHDERAADVDVVVLAREVGARAAQVEAVHDARQLRAHVVGALQRPEVHEVVVAPLRILVICSRHANKLSDVIVKREVITALSYWLNLYFVTV